MERHLARFAGELFVKGEFESLAPLGFGPEQFVVFHRAIQRRASPPGVAEDVRCERAIGVIARIHGMQQEAVAEMAFHRLLLDGREVLQDVQR